MPFRDRVAAVSQYGLGSQSFFLFDFEFFVSQVQKPSVCVYRLFVSVCAIGLAWGVALAIWDIMIASGQYYKAMSGGDTVQAFLERGFLCISSKESEYLNQ